MIKISSVLIVCLSIVFFIACEKEDGNETKISKNNTDDSHQFGKNCMSCHVSGNDAEGWFTVAGSVYNNTKTSAYRNGEVKLTTGPNGSGALVKMVEVDIKGSFYTTEAVDFGNGLYVLVEGTNGEQKVMVSKITNGSCSSCHGKTTEVIWMD